MKRLSIIAIVAAVVSLIMGVTLRIVQTRFFTLGLTANAFLRFADTALLFAIVLVLFQLLQAKKEG